MKYDGLTPIANIGLAAPAVRALHGAGYHTLKDVAKTSDADLASLHGFGPKAQKQLHQALADAGLRDPVDTKPTEDITRRVSYEGFKGFWPSVADDPNATPIQREISRLNNAIDKVVISDSLTSEETDPWPNTRIIRRADAHQQIAELKRQSGKEILVFGSRTLWNDLLANDLVDELHLMIGPVVLSAGTPLFDGRPPISLRLIDTRTWHGSGNVLVRYEIGRQKS